jgi:predicted transposase YbfD/YdcC
VLLLFTAAHGEHLMADSRHISLDEVVLHFAGLEDPRSTVNLQHPLISVVVIALMAVLAGAGGPTAIGKWAALKEEFLLNTLDLPNGIPRKDVFRRVLMTLRPGAFQACFANWLNSLRATAAATTGVEQPVLAVDGKTVRRSHDRKNGLGALHSVSVWASEFGLSLGQVACAEKSNEITAIPELLRMVDIKGAIITIDAMGTQKAIAAEIIDGKADYVLGLKGNQESLHKAVIDHFNEKLDGDLGTAREHVTTEKGHGREETRTYLQLPAPKDLPGYTLWKGLKSIGIVTSLCLRNGKETIEIRYYISSLAVSVKKFARAVRGHWGIENTCHWVLDMTYREDESRIRDQALRENFAWLNRFTLSLLKQHPDRTSLVMKRRSCGWNENYLLKVLAGATV